MSHELLKLTDPSFIAEGDPHAIWRTLRAEDPVAWTPEANGPGFWSITRYDDGVRVFKDWEIFSSARGTVLTRNRGQADPAGGKMLPLMDPPRHTQIRRLLQRFFTPQRINALSPGVRDCVRTLVRDGCELGRFDFVQEIASRLPVRVFFTIMDIPSADWDTLFYCILKASGPNQDEQQRANTELLLYFSDLAAERRRRPGDDLVSAVAAMEVDDSRLPDEEVILNCVGLIAAGVDTTRLAAAGGLHALLQWPDQWRLLQADQALVALAVDEIVRWTSPVIHLYRTATKDVAFRNRQIRRNDRLVVWIPSLNRDERQFPNADHFMVSRTPNHHIGFGVGVHLCIGAALTRLELQVLFRELATKWKTVVATGAARRFRSFLVHGVDYLPVSVVPR